MQTVRAIVEYDGTAFFGFQVQPSARTVGGVLEAALTQLHGEIVKVSCAGRTDAGVHATGQVISFRSERDFPIEKMMLALNGNLPSDVSVRTAEIAPEDFSARFSALERTYVYAVLNQSPRSALANRFAYHFYSRLDVDKMRTAAEQLIGEHDFRSFCGLLPESGPTMRTIKQLTIERRAEIVRISITGDGFLHRMVRNIVGTLLDLGSGRRELDIARVLAAKQRDAAGHTAPPQGLYLAGVRYADFDSYCEPLITRG